LGRVERKAELFSVRERTFWRVIELPGRKNIICQEKGGEIELRKERDIRQRIKGVN